MTLLEKKDFSRDLLSHVESQGETWCQWLLEPKYTEKEKDYMVELIRKTHKGTIFSKDGKRLKLSAIRTMVHNIDKIWFQGHLIPGLIKGYGAVHYKIDNSNSAIAAYVLEYKNKIELCFNQKLFCATFKRGEKGFHAGGLLCRSRYECFMHILLHEVCHLALSLCDRWRYWSDHDPHGPMFEKIVHNFYGHTDANHGIIPGFSQTLPLNQIKQVTKVGQKVRVFTVDKNGNHQWLGGKIKKKMEKEAVVVMNGDEYMVNYGLICATSNECGV